MMMLLTVLLNAFRNGGKSLARHWAAALYAVFFILLFTIVYWRMGLTKHFDVPDYIEPKKRNGFGNALYTSMLAQSNAMPDLTPKTTLARMLFMVQVTTGWLWFLVFGA